MSLMTTLILVAAGLVGATGLILGLFLGVASEKFKVEVDERRKFVPLSREVTAVPADFRDVTAVQKQLRRDRLP